MMPNDKMPFGKLKGLTMREIEKDHPDYVKILMTRGEVNDWIKKFHPSVISFFRGKKYKETLNAIPFQAKKRMKKAEEDLEKKIKEAKELINESN